jgi:Flp pilus assembly protein TadG
MKFLGQKGQSIVEITLMTPLVLIALYVPFDFGMTIFTGHITQNAVRDGARIASSTQPFDDTAADALALQVYNTLPQLLVSGSSSPKRVTVNYYADGPAECAQSVEVVAQGTYNFFLYRLMALAGFTVPNGIGITRTTRMRYQHQPTTNGGTGATTTFCGGITVTEIHP